MATKKKSGKVGRPLDTAHSGRGVWLVKVPNYLSDAWNNAKKHQTLGKMRITSTAGKAAQVQFFLAPELVKYRLSDDKEIDLPAEHRVSIQQTANQHTFTFSENLTTGAVTSEGKIVQRADIQPVNNPLYMALKKKQIQEAEKTKFTVQHLSGIRSAYKPVAIHKEEKMYSKKKKEELKKARDDKETVFDLLFSAFEQHQFYSFKDLVEKTQQPAAYLKEILREVCLYHTKSPHKFMWELKPEYKQSQLDLDSEDMET